MGALMNSLNLALEYKCSVFTPSSIGAFGENTPHHMTPQDTVMRPNTIYGVCKVTGELLGDYYHSRFGVDARSVRFPGIISNGALPGGGTTDYAVEVFYEVAKHGKYTCEVPADRYMDMLYIGNTYDDSSGFDGFNLIDTVMKKVDVLGFLESQEVNHNNERVIKKE